MLASFLEVGQKRASWRERAQSNLPPPVCPPVRARQLSTFCHLFLRSPPTPTSLFPLRSSLKERRHRLHSAVELPCFWILDAHSAFGGHLGMLFGVGTTECPASEREPTKSKKKG